MDSKTLLQRLDDASPNGPLDRLAGLALEDLLDRKLSELVPADQALDLTRRALFGWVESEQAVPALQKTVEALVERASVNQHSVKESMSRDLRHALRDIVGRPFSPNRKVVLTILDRDPVRELVRQLLLDAILDFGKKVSAPVAGVARGLGSLARLATETVKARGGGLGSLVGAVSGEVERQLEKRAVEFVDAALGGVLGKIADSIADPRRATEAAELRVAMFDGVMELSMAQLSRELVNADVPGGAEVLRSGLKRWLASAESDAHLRAIADFVLDREGSRPFREVLAEGGLLETVRIAGRDLLRARMHEVVRAPAFAAWLEELFTVS